MERRTTKETWEEYGQQNDDIIVDSFSGMYERRLVPRAQSSLQPKTEPINVINLQRLYEPRRIRKHGLPSHLRAPSSPQIIAKHRPPSSHTSMLTGRLIGSGPSTLNPNSDTPPSSPRFHIPHQRRLAQ